MIVILTASPLLWMVGGTWWKPARRMLLPLLLIGLLLGVVPWWQAVGAGGTLAVATTLPYGDHTWWRGRWFVFQSYGLPVMWLDWRMGVVWAFLMAGVVTFLMLLSYRFNRFTWKIWEALVGLLVGAGVVMGSLR